MKLSKSQINDMARELESGMKIFINKDTLEYRTILDWEDMMDPEPWEEETEKIETSNNFLMINI